MSPVLFNNALWRAKAKAADASRRSVFDLTELILQTMLSFESRATKKNLDVDPQLPDSHLMVIADKDAKIDALYIQLGTQREAYNAKVEENTELKVYKATNEVKLCMRRGCGDREPQSGY